MSKSTNNDFVEKLKYDLSKPKDRFEIHNPLYDSKKEVNTSQEAIKEANLVGSSRFQYITPEGKVYQIGKNKNDERWYQIERNPKYLNEKNYTLSLVDIQKSIDRKNLQSIRDNEKLRAALKEADPETNIKMAKADILSFRKIQDIGAQKAAAEIMAKNANTYPDYKKEIIKTSPETLRKIVEIASIKKSKSQFVAQKSQNNNNKKTSHSENTIESDEIFTASEPEKNPVLPPDLEKEYTKVGNKYYAENGSSFEDKGNRIETQSNEERVTSSMILIAKARGWNEIKVSGSESFKKEAWIEANSKGMHVKGYIPQRQDKEELSKRTGKMDYKRDGNQEEPESKSDTHSKKMAKTWATKDPQEAARIYPELANATALAVAIDKRAEADGLNPAQRAVVAARTKQNIINSIEKGNLPRMKIREEVEITTNRNEKELVR
ncbi:hypothetical protein FCL47_22240 [Desulfopila sp. IMCC35006]|uniref:LPD7 domain-containing protein n=1 Tax=Desulfopila sp. IMCC35006 TaxID=2569542 RepID=UPI0010AC5AE4|nr:LPD7 domain-containing protein [Desulfopila sp. IMCC35006]TKB23478.1 hypothetical protein FCL47_22240 [Desulfopila sp. IMCC35006]